MGASQVDIDIVVAETGVAIDGQNMIGQYIGLLETGLNVLLLLLHIEEGVGRGATNG